MLAYSRSALRPRTIRRSLDAPFPVSSRLTVPSSLSILKIPLSETRCSSSTQKQTSPGHIPATSRPRQGFHLERYCSGIVDFRSTIFNHPSHATLEPKSEDGNFKARRRALADLTHALLFLTSIHFSHHCLYFARVQASTPKISQTVRILDLACPWLPPFNWNSTRQLASSVTLLPTPSCAKRPLTATIMSVVKTPTSSLTGASVPCLSSSRCILY